MPFSWEFPGNRPISIVQAGEELGHVSEGHVWAGNGPKRGVELPVSANFSSWSGSSLGAKRQLLMGPDRSRGWGVLAFPRTLSTLRSYPAPPGADPDSFYHLTRFSPSPLEFPPRHSCTDLTRSTRNDRPTANLSWWNPCQTFAWEGKDSRLPVVAGRRVPTTLKC